VLLKIEKNPEVSVVILTGKQGNASFATGANISELKESTMNT